jgi:hypothetical protein
MRHRRLRPPADRDDAAVAAVPRSAPPGSVERGGLRRGLVPDGGAAGREGPPGDRPRALVDVPPVLRSPDRLHEVAGRSRPGPASVIGLIATLHLTGRRAHLTIEKTRPEDWANPATAPNARAHHRLTEERGGQADSPAPADGSRTQPGSRPSVVDDLAASGVGGTRPVRPAWPAAGPRLARWRAGLIRMTSQARWLRSRAHHTPPPIVSTCSILGGAPSRYLRAAPEPAPELGPGRSQVGFSGA